MRAACPQGDQLDAARDVTIDALARLPHERGLRLVTLNPLIHRHTTDKSSDRPTSLTSRSMPLCASTATTQATAAGKSWTSMQQDALRDLDRHLPTPGFTTRRDHSHWAATVAARCSWTRTLGGR